MTAPSGSSVPAVILAAGGGSRLNGGTSPKCLTSVQGRPLVAWIIRALTSAGVGTVYLILGNRANEVEDAVPCLQGGAVVRTARCEDWTLGNGRSAAHAKAVIGGAKRFLLLMGDHLISRDHVSALLHAPAPPDERCMLATSPSGVANSVDIEDATKVLAQPDGRIVDIGKALKTYNAIDTGVFLVTPSLFPALERAKDAGDCSLTGGNRILAAEGLLFAHSIGELHWQDVDTEADLKAATAMARTMDSSSGSRQKEQ